MFPDNSPAGNPSDPSRGTAPRVPPTLPVFPNAPTPVRARKPAAAVPVLVESDDADVDKYAKHVEAATASVPIFSAFTSPPTAPTPAGVPVAPAHPPHRGGGLGSRQAAIARTRRWAVRLVVSILIVWFILSQIVAWRNAGTSMAGTARPIPHRGSARTRTTTTEAARLTAAPVGGTMSPAFTITSTTITIPSTGTAPEKATHEANRTVQPPEAPRSPTLSPSSSASHLLSSSASPSSYLSSSSASALPSVAPPTDALGELRHARRPAPHGASDSPPHAQASSALDGSSAPSFHVLSSSLSENAESDGEESERAVRSPMASSAESHPVVPGALSITGSSSTTATAATIPSTTTPPTTTRPTRTRATTGTFTVVTVVAAPEVLAVAGDVPDTLVASDSLSAHRLEYLARGLYRSGVMQHARFYEWLLFRPAHIHNEAAQRERDAVRQWWCEEQQDEERLSTQAWLSAGEGSDCTGNTSVVARTDTSVCVAVMNAVVRVAHSQRPRVTKPAALWLEAAVGVQTTFIVLHELHWGVRLPAPSAHLFNPTVPANQSGVSTVLARWYALAPSLATGKSDLTTTTTTTATRTERQVNSSAVETGDKAVCSRSRPLPPLHALRKAYMGHLLEVGVQVLSAEQGGAEPMPGDSTSAAHAAIPPVVVELGNFRDARERGAHVYRLQYYASLFDRPVSNSREVALTRQMQSFLALVSEGKANMGAPRAPANTTEAAQTALVGSDDRADSRSLGEEADEEEATRTTTRAVTGGTAHVLESLVDGLPTARYGADPLYHCHRAPLYSVSLPVPDYMRGGGGRQARRAQRSEDDGLLSSAAPPSASVADVVTLCDLLVDRKHHGYMANFTAAPLPFYEAYCRQWQTFVGQEQTLLAAQPALKTGDKKEDAARQQQLAKAQSRLLKSNRLAEGVCMYEWVRVLKEEQLKAKKREPRTRPPHTQSVKPQKQEVVREERKPLQRGGARGLLRGGQLLAVDAEDGSEAAPSRDDVTANLDVNRTGTKHISAQLAESGEDELRTGTPLERYARMLYSANTTVRLYLAHHFLSHANANMTQTLEEVTQRVSAKLDKMPVSYVVADGKRRKKQQQVGDVEVVCLPSRSAVFNLAPAMYRTKWLTDNIIFKCQKRLNDCVGKRSEDDARSIQTMQTYLTGAMQWSQGVYHVCTVPGLMVEDTAAGLLALQNETQRS